MGNLDWAATPAATIVKMCVCVFFNLISSKNERPLTEAVDDTSSEQQSRLASISVTREILTLCI